MNQVSDKSGNFRAKIIYEIATGVYQMGDRLPSEREFCNRHGISRTTIRQVMDELTAQSIVERRARSGMFISPRALEMINQRQNDTSLSIVIIMPSLQITNPLVQQIFMLFNQYVGPEVKSSVIFADVLRQDILKDVQADVAVIFANNDPRQLAVLSRQVKTMVLLNTVNADYNYITPDNYAGGRLMAEYILSCGHQDVSCIRLKTNDDNSDFQQRFMGIRDVLTESGCTPVMAQLEPRNYFDIFFPCRKALDKILDAHPRLTAIMCLSDLMAMGMYEALRTRKLSIPDDISVIGFDEQYFSQYTLPPLTTVKYPAEAIGIKLAEFINQLLKGKSNRIQEKVQPILIKRESVKEMKS